MVRGPVWRNYIPVALVESVDGEQILRELVPAIEEMLLTDEAETEGVGATFERQTDAGVGRGFACSYCTGTSIQTLRSRYSPIATNVRPVNTIGLSR